MPFNIDICTQLTSLVRFLRRTVTQRESEQNVEVDIGTTLERSDVRNRE